MIIFPAIDIKDHKVVRLKQGRFQDVTEYSTDPVSVAEKWVEAGASWIHVVDLDGAHAGVIKNWDVLKALAEAIPVPIQFGGGIRLEEDLARLFQLGIRRAVLGTVALKDTEFLRAVVRRWPDQIAVSLDCQDGRVSSHGWTNVSDVLATEIVKTLAAAGVTCLIYTDIARDGMMTGPNIKALQQLLGATRIPVIASGGISGIKDLKALKTLEPKGLMGAITGKAIYEGTLDLKEAIAQC